MTAEAVDLGCRIGVAGLAKSILAENAIGLGVSVAVNAILQTIFRRSDTTPNSVFTLMNDEIHVIAAHEIGIGHAFVASEDSYRRTDARRLRRGNVGSHCITEPR